MKLLLFLLLFTSCVHSKFDEAISRKQCEDALVLADSMDKIEEYKAKGSQISRSAIKYTIQAGTYIGEAIIIPTTTLLGTTAILASCSSSLVLANALNICVLGINNSGEWFLRHPESTREIRAEVLGIDRLDLSPLARSVRVVSECYISRKTKPDLLLAQSHLNTFKMNPSLYQHISGIERIRIDDLLEQIKIDLESRAEG